MRRLVVTRSTNRWLQASQGEGMSNQGMDILKLAYDLLLESEVPGLSTSLKRNPGAYDMAFKYWLDKTTDEAIQRAKDRCPPDDTIQEG